MGGAEELVRMVRAAMGRYVKHDRGAGVVLMCIGQMRIV